jgi:hypothetical protein
MPSFAVVATGTPGKTAVSRDINAAFEAPPPQTYISFAPTQHVFTARAMLAAVNSSKVA